MAPPRKRARTAVTSQTPTHDTPPASSPPPPSAKSGAPDTPTQSHHLATSDHWTPSQTTSLFKSIIRAKPTGIHRHIHMLTILQSIHDDHIAAGHGSVPPARNRRPALPRHLRREGVWKKLDSLYDLSALDEREEAYRRTGPQFRRGRDGVAREVISGSDNEDSDIMESTEERSFSLLGQGDDVDSEQWEGIHDTLSASRDPEERDLARMMWERRLRDHHESAGESSSEELAENIEADADTKGHDDDDDDDDDDEGDAKLKVRISRRASTRHAAASTPAASSPGAEEPGDEDEDGGDEGTSKPDSTTKATRSSTRTALGRATRKK